MIREQILCFNNVECVYTDCKQFNKQLDTCNFIRIGLLGDTAPTTTRTQPTQTPIDADYRFINTIKTGDEKVTVIGRLINDPYIGTVKSRQGELVDIGNITIDDGTGELRITFWRNEAKKVRPFKANDRLRIENIYQIKDPFEGVLQANAGKYCKIIPQ